MGLYWADESPPFFIALHAAYISAKPLPKGLIRKIALFRAREVREEDVRWMERKR